GHGRHWRHAGRHGHRCLSNSRDFLCGREAGYADEKGGTRRTLKFSRRRERTMSKIQDSRSKTQKNSNCQTPKRVPFWFGFGVWVVFGIWILEFVFSLVLGGCCLVFLTGCAFGPTYTQPDCAFP